MRNGSHFQIPQWSKKLLAAIVITICLSAQLYATVRPSGSRLWPFLDYPMYSRSRAPGATVRVRELRAIACGSESRAWKVEPHTIGYQSYRYTGELGAIVANRASARRHRANFARLVVARGPPHPCALQVWERKATVTDDGIDASSLRDVRRLPLLEWRVDDPDAVRSFTHRDGQLP